MKIKGILHYLESFHRGFKSNERIASLLEQLIKEITTQYNREKTINNDIQCLYIIETSLGHVKVGISKSPLQRIKHLTTGGGYRVTNHYVTHPIDHPAKKEKELLNFFRESSMPGEYLNVKFQDVVSQFEKTYGSQFKNQQFQLTYSFTSYYDKAVYGSNGKVYQSYKTFAKAFGISKKKALEALNTGIVIKGITIRSMKSKSSVAQSTHQGKSTEENKVFQPKTILRKKEPEIIRLVVVKTDPLKEETGSESLLND